MIWDADTDSTVVVVVKMMKTWFFRKDNGKFAGDIFFDNGFSKG